VWDSDSSGSVGGRTDQGSYEEDDNRDEEDFADEGSVLDVGLWEADFPKGIVVEHGIISLACCLPRESDGRDGVSCALEKQMDYPIPYEEGQKHLGLVRAVGRHSRSNKVEVAYNTCYPGIFLDCFRFLRF
jgi:hypothetical protein